MRNQKLSLIVGILVISLLTVGAVEAAGELNLMTWGGDFIPRVIIDEFTAETGIRVNYKEVTSNEDMQSLLEANPDQYDLAVVTDYMVDILRQNDMLEVLDKGAMPNYANINPVYHGAYYDPETQYSIPYAVSKIGRAHV